MFTWQRVLDWYDTDLPVPWLIDCLGLEGLELYSRRVTCLRKCFEVSCLSRLLPSLPLWCDFGTQTRRRHWHSIVWSPSQQQRHVTETWVCCIVYPSHHIAVWCPIECSSVISSEVHCICLFGPGHAWYGGSRYDSVTVLHICMYRWPCLGLCGVCDGSYVHTDAAVNMYDYGSGSIETYVIHRPTSVCDQVFVEDISIIS